MVKQKDLDQEKNLRAFGFWYIGLKRKTHKIENSNKQNDDINAYYWELLMELRKTTLIFINSLGSNINVLYRAFLMLFVLYITCILVAKIQPYRKQYLNTVHYIADIGALITFGTAIGLEEVKSNSLLYIWFAIMIIFNWVFLTFFIYKFANFVIQDKKEQRRIKKEKREIFQTFFTYFGFLELLKEAEEFIRLDKLNKVSSGVNLKRRKKA